MDQEWYDCQSWIRHYLVKGKQRYIVTQWEIWAETKKTPWDHCMRALSEHFLKTLLCSCLNTFIKIFLSQIRWILHYVTILTLIWIFDMLFIKHNKLIFEGNCVIHKSCVRETIIKALSILAFRVLWKRSKISFLRWKK